uniref:Uncharacterized protein n=1 Tax=Anguilla anguilla TaxID=7936 RepID=A0A0E9XW51_ANGAN
MSSCALTSKQHLLLPILSMLGKECAFCSVSK